MRKHIMNTLKANGIITRINAESAKPSFHEQAYCVIFSGSVMSISNKQNDEYPLER